MDDCAYSTSTDGAYRAQGSCPNRRQGQHGSPSGCNNHQSTHSHDRAQEYEVLFVALDLVIDFCNILHHQIVKRCMFPLNFLCLDNSFGRDLFHVVNAIAHLLNVMLFNSEFDIFNIFGNA